MTGGLRIGVIGTGEMGRPLVDRLLAAGHEVAAFARRPEVRDELASAGVEVVDDLVALAASRDIVVLYVYSDEQVRDLALDGGMVEAMAPGSLLAIGTTGSPETAVLIAERGASRGVHVVDIPASGGPQQVAAGALTVFVGGDEAAVEQARPLLDAYTTTAVHFGPVGSGQKVKLLNNLLFGAHVELAVQAARICQAMGLDETTVTTALHGCSGASAAIDMAAATGSTDQLLALAGRFVHKDVVVARALAADLEIDLGVLEPVTDRVLQRTHDH
jgi:3-hydroxyisobutyrate dehydrogenase-like beta-hydroxyacid dehydrogenase